MSHVSNIFNFSKLSNAALACACIACFCAPNLRAEQPNGGDTVDLTTIPSVPDPKVAALVVQLGAPDTVQREDAEKSLLLLGKRAAAQLKLAENSVNPEVAFRAKRLGARIAEAAIKPASYAAILPSDAVFYMEFSDAPATLERSKSTPFGKLWDTQSMRTFVMGYRAAMLPTDLKVFDAITQLPKLASGRAMFGLSSPDTIEAHEIDPPLLYVLETKNIQIVEAQIRTMFEGMNDAPKSKRQFKNFQIEEQNNACTVFGAERVIHALTPKGLESFLDNLLKPPAKPLTVLLTDLKAQRPNADIYARLSANGLPALADANQIIDDDQVKMTEAAGLADGGFIEDAMTLNAEGIEEFIRISAGGDMRNKGLLALLQRSGLSPAPPLQANQPQALDLIPFQAALVASFSVDVAKNSAELSAALRSLDSLTGMPMHPETNNNAAPGTDANRLPGSMKPSEAVAPPRPPPPATSRAAQALLEGGGDVLQDKKIGKEAVVDSKQPGKKMTKPAEPERSMPHIERLLKAGFTLEQLFEQTEGPMVLALFPERVDITKLAKPEAVDNPPDPDRIPLAALFALYLKNPQPIEMALEKANIGLKPRYLKQVLNGGTYYAEDDDENSGGFWLSGRYLVFGTSKDIVELAGAAALNQNGTERMAARKTYVDYMNKYYDPKALLNVFADSRQFLEMPYKMAQLQWQDNPKNPWPDYALLAGLLKGNMLRIKVKQAQGGLQIEAQTPISILGLIQTVRKPLKEANLLQ